jgi:hypothetical protein
VRRTGRRRDRRGSARRTAARRGQLGYTDAGKRGDAEARTARRGSETRATPRPARRGYAAIRATRKPGPLGEAGSSATRATRTPGKPGDAGCGKAWLRGQPGDQATQRPARLKRPGKPRKATQAHDQGKLGGGLADNPNDQDDAEAPRKPGQLGDAETGQKSATR